MKWPWSRKPTAAADTPEEPTVAATPSDETLRAVQAAQAAAVHLQESRDRRPQVNGLSAEIARSTGENHFRDIIRQAFGSGS